MIDTFLTPNGKPVVLEMRDGTTDWNTLNACLSEDEYAFRGRHFTGYALDIGAHLGGVSIGLAADNPDLHVIAVEAVPPNAELLRANIARNGLSDRITVLEGAAGGRKPVDVWYGFRGTELAEAHAWIGNNSTAYDHGGELPHETAHYPHPWTLAALVKMAGGHVSLCKIDCEGGEWSFLPSKALGQVDEIIGEVHPVRGHKPNDILTLPSPTHHGALLGANQEHGPCGFVVTR